MAHLSNIELYYSPPEFIENEKIILDGEEFHHAVNVMRNSIGDTLHITDGCGKFFITKIIQIKKNRLITVIEDKKAFDNPAEKICFCIPFLKNPGRIKFALEKCVELGITNFILITSKHTISKKVNSNRFYKTTLSAMKQSLRTYLPKIIPSNFDEIIKLPGIKILFDQSAGTLFNGNIKNEMSTYFLFGPEGGFDKTEIDSFGSDMKYSLSTNRLRSETAVIKCASLLKFI